MNEQSRIQELIDLFQVLNPTEKITSQYVVRGTTLETLGRTGSGGYQRVLAWARTKVAEKDQRQLKFSGKKDTYDTGATRDSSEGKGRYDLISPLFLRRIAIVLEKGAKNHGDNNWQKGIPYSRLIDSAFRHISQFNCGMDDEDHLAQAVTNLMFLIHFQEHNRDDLNNINPKPYD